MNERKQIVSMRLGSSERSAVRSAAERLYIRESDFYRFAVKFLLIRLDKLLDNSLSGSDLLKIFIELREDINNNLKLSKEQLHRIINLSTDESGKLVAMSDIELLLLPHAQLRQRLQRVCPVNSTNLETTEWLNRYLSEKYNLDNDNAVTVEKSQSGSNEASFNSTA